MKKQEIDAIRKRCEAATPAPWIWDANSVCHQIHLVGACGMYPIVMDFTRWGMQDAAPRFPIDGIMERADKMLKSFPGKEHHIGFDNTVNHPNADFIAHARADVPALLDEVERLQKDKNRISSEYIMQKGTIAKQDKEIAALEKALGKYRNTEQWLDDMANPLEPIKIQAALDSEIMKLNYRKEHKPESTSELDGTIIAALMFALEAKEGLKDETNII